MDNLGSHEIVGASARTVEAVSDAIGQLLPAFIPKEKGWTKNSARVDMMHSATRLWSSYRQKV